jgi:hypothetical protein
MRQHLQAKEEGGESQPPPPLRRLLCSDTTVEKLAEVLEDNPRGVLVYRDELHGWLKSFARYKGKGGGSDLPAWLEMHRGGQVTIDRKTGERRLIVIPQAAVSITGGIQPGVLAHALSSEHLDAGLGARLLLAMPPRQPKRWTEDDISSETAEAYTQLLDRLLGLIHRTGPDGEKLPDRLLLTAEAKRLWLTYFNAWGEEQAAAEGDLASAFAKIEAYAARLALIHHSVTHVAASNDGCAPVGPVSLEAGITLAHWFAGEARRIYSFPGEGEESRDLRRLVEYVQGRGGRVTARDLQRSNARRYPSPEDAEAALKNLVEQGLATVEDRPPSRAGGRPTREYVLLRDPTDDKTDGTSP